MKLLEFNHPSENFHIRRVDHNGADWFIARDICESLGIDQTGPALTKLEPDWVNQIHIPDALKRSRPTYIVSEAGLYAMIMRSDKPAARAFSKWVCVEVLPALRKAGVYSLTGKMPLESLKVRRLEVLLRAARLREEAVCLEMQGALAFGLPGGVPIRAWVEKHHPKLAPKQRANMVRSIKRWADFNQRPIGMVTRPHGGGMHLTMLPEDIEACPQAAPQLKAAQKGAAK